MPAHYPHLLDVKSYPDYDRRSAPAPSWETFDHAPQFTCLRAFTIRDNKLQNWRDDLDLYTRQFRLGRIIWPVFPTVFTENFAGLVREIARRGLYLFDIWGHVPGSSYEGMWNHAMPPEGMVQWLGEELGDRFLGFDNGEQDGRYIGGYAVAQCPSPQDRFAQYLNFQRHFQRMGDDLGNRLVGLVSITYGHYYLKEGNHILLGAETAQALPNSQVYYAFIRGACRQYGLHWFGNASIFNRWGYKSYMSRGEDGSRQFGPEHGTSLSLLKRLLYSHYLYNAVAIGFEQSWLVQDNVEKRLLGEETEMEKDRCQVTLSPVGEIQAAAVRFVERCGPPGVMHAPVALLMDHFSGWCVPRHLYTWDVYRVWGQMPYERCDYLTHSVLGMLYPNYEDSSFFRNERGFLSATPYGDMTDCLLSDAPGWVLAQYGLIVLAGGVRADQELRDKLECFVRAGGELVVGADNARRLWPEWRVVDPDGIRAGETVEWADGKSCVETHAFELCPAEALPPGAEVLASVQGRPAVAEVPIGEGRVTLLLSPWGMNALPAARPDRADFNQPLAQPHVLLSYVRRILHEAFSRQHIFAMDGELHFVTCRKPDGRYTLGVFNNNWCQRPLNLTCRAGQIVELREIEIESPEKGQVGYLPYGLGDVELGVSDDEHIAGGDVRLFDVKLAEPKVTLLSKATPPSRPERRGVAIRGCEGLKESVLAWPTFFQHFDTAKIDWMYLHMRDAEQVRRERPWLDRQKLRIVVDFSSSLNFYPDLTLLDTLAFRYAESVSAIDDVLDKMSLLGAKEAVISLHRIPENHCTPERAEERFLAGARSLCERADRRGVTLALQHHPFKHRPTLPQTAEFVDAVACDNLALAINTGHLRDDDLPDAASYATRAGIVLVSEPCDACGGRPTDAHLPLAHASTSPIGWLDATSCDVVLDGWYQTWNDVYNDIRQVWPSQQAR